MWSPRHLVGALAAALVLTGCSGGFDPAKEEPCAFLTTADLEKLGLLAQPTEPRDCMLVPKAGWSTGIAEGRVGFRPVPVERLALDSGLVRTAEFGPHVGYRSQDKITDTGRAPCVLVGRIDDTSSWVVSFIVDKSRVFFESEPQHDPCRYLMDNYSRVADRLGAPHD